MTEPYSADFIEKYIGSKTFDEYKQTSMYAQVYEQILKQQKKNEATFNVVKNNYIDTDRMEEIILQAKLMHEWDIGAVFLVNACEKAVKIYCCDGLQMYFTNKNTNRISLSSDSRDIMKFSESENRYNQKYDEVYISKFIIKDEVYFIEHNEILNEKEIEIINTMINAFIPS